MTEFTQEQIEGRAQDLYRVMKLYPNDTWNIKTISKTTKQRFRSGSRLVLGLEYAAYLRGYEQAREDAAKVCDNVEQILKTLPDTESFYLQHRTSKHIAAGIRKLEPHQ